MLRLIALVLPLGLDTFAVAAAVGMGGLTRRQRLRVSLVFAAFEGVMPLIGADADYAAGALLIILGGCMLWPRDETSELEAAAGMTRTHGAALIGLGLSVSIDELAIGFSAGLLRLPILLAVALIATQAFIAAQLGVRLGARIGEEVRAEGRSSFPRNCSTAWTPGTSTAATPEDGHRGARRRGEGRRGEFGGRGYPVTRSGRKVFRSGSLGVRLRTSLKS